MLNDVNALSAIRMQQNVQDTPQAAQPRRVFFYPTPYTNTTPRITTCYKQAYVLEF